MLAKFELNSRGEGNGKYLQADSPSLAISNYFPF